LRVIGSTAARALLERYRGDRIYVAKLDYALRVTRNIEIASKYVAGTPVNQLARTYRLSERQIWNILKQPETLRDTSDDKQQLLF
jgi:Mor family transcriptional regulator